MPIVSITEETMMELQTMYKWHYTTVKLQHETPFDDYVEGIIKQGIILVSKVGNDENE